MSAPDRTRGSAPIEVIKLGGSVLRTASDYRLTIDEARRALRRGRRPLLVMSAAAGTTDRLLAAAHGLSDRPDEACLAQLLATGEANAAALAGIVLADAGLAVRVLDATTLDLRVRGPRLAARPVSVDTARLRDTFEDAAVVVVPGFVGHHAAGGAALLGRGGSDLTALFLAHQLGARCRLVKDTGALYTADPRHVAGARRYLRASWRTTRSAGGGLVQAETLRFAAELRLRLLIAAPAGPVGTVIDDGPDILASAPRAGLPKCSAQALGGAA